VSTKTRLAQGDSRITIYGFVVVVLGVLASIHLTCMQNDGECRSICPQLNYCITDIGIEIPASLTKTDESPLHCMGSVNFTVGSSASICQGQRKSCNCFPRRPLSCTGRGCRLQSGPFGSSLCILCSISQDRREHDSLSSSKTFEEKRKSSLRSVLKQKTIRPKKSMGQNFMADEGVLESTVAAATLDPEDVVVEVGPGTGALTRHLLQTGAHIIAIEKDESLHAHLKLEFANSIDAGQLSLVCGDVLKIDLASVVDSQLGMLDNCQYQGKVHVVANLPYNITKSFLVQSLPLGNKFSRLLLMLQEEVAVRLTASRPGDPDWRAINIIIDYLSSPRYLFKIDRRKYIPMPKCHGAVVDFDLIPPDQRPPLPCAQDEFFRFVKRGFLQRRKALRNSLQPSFESTQVTRALESLGLSPNTRAQELSMVQFVELMWALHRS
jgi:ribosomal RNA small subunit methyltransferase A